ncbi:MAG: NRDE family protein [Magnetococcales bacterium]|nr:NRDE family protein [Magnetococcales bacterium]
MCILVILRRPEHPCWPLLIGANRDEMRHRPWAPPGAHWVDQPDILGGLDRIGQGTWLALSRWGVVATVLNRTGTLGGQPGKRSRGALPLLALEGRTAREGVERVVTRVDPGGYQACNLVVADRRDAFWIVLDPERIGSGGMAVAEVPGGISILSSGDLNDTAQVRSAAHLPRFREAPIPRPEVGDWSGWRALLGNREPVVAGQQNSAMCFQLASGFGTVSSSLIALSGDGGVGRWLFAPGSPDVTDHTPVSGMGAWGGHPAL